jgi:hypothetical protein
MVAKAYFLVNQSSILTKLLNCIVYILEVMNIKCLGYIITCYHSSDYEELSEETVHKFHQKGNINHTGLQCLP